MALGGIPAPIRWCRPRARTVRLRNGRPVGDRGRTHDPRRRPGEDRRDRVRPNRLDVGYPAVRPHHARIREPGVASLVEQPPEVPLDRRRHVRVGDGRRRPLELAKLAANLVGGRHRNVERLAEERRDSTFVLGMRVRVKQRDGDALDLLVVRVARFRPDARGEVANRVLVDPVAGPVDGGALVDLEPSPARHERRGLLRAEVVQRRPVLSADLEDVTEPSRRHQRRRRAVAFEQRVHRNGHRVGERVDVARFDPRGGTALTDPPKDALALRLRRRHFRRRKRAVDEQRHVGERAADVDAQPDGVVA